MSTLGEDVEKTKKVINTCDNHNHLWNAIKYCLLFSRKHTHADEYNDLFHKLIARKTKELDDRLKLPIPLIQGSKLTL